MTDKAFITCLWFDTDGERWSASAARSRPGRCAPWAAK